MIHKLFLLRLLGARHRKAPLAEGYLGPVGQEYCAGQVPRDAAQQVDDGDAVPAGKLLQVSQDGHLETHRDQAVQDPAGMAEQLAEEPPQDWEEAASPSTNSVTLVLRGRQAGRQGVLQLPSVQLTLHGGRVRAKGGKPGQEPPG